MDELKPKLGSLTLIDCISIVWVSQGLGLAVGALVMHLEKSSHYEQDQTYQCSNKSCLVADFPGIKSIGLDGKVKAFVTLVVLLLFYRAIA
ncbi:hypothetical protein R6Q57_022625 [Mikania cordata]